MENYKLSNLSSAIIETHSTNYLMYKQAVLQCDIKGNELFKTPFRTDFAAILCTQGEMVLNINFKSYKVKKGTLILNMSQNILHSEKCSTNFEAKIIVMSELFFKQTLIDLKLMISEFVYLKQNPCLEVDDLSIERFKTFYKMLTYILKHSSSASMKSSLSAAFTIFIYQFHDMITLQKEIDNQSHTKKGSRKEILFNQFMDLLQVHFKKEHSVTFYAEKLCLSPKYFSTTIKEVSSKGVLEWIDSYILAEAKLLLKFSDKPIYEIAEELNFASATCFGKYFKHHVKMTPGKYRVS